MAETKEGVFDAAARAVKAAVEFMAGKKVDETKLAAEPQTLKVKEGDPITADADGTVTSGQADGDYALEDGSTVSIKDGKLGEIQPAKTEDDTAAADDDSKEAEKADDAPAAADDTTKTDDVPEDNKPEADDKPVSQAELIAFGESLLAGIKELISEQNKASEEKLAAVETKLSAEFETVKRQPAVGKQGPATHNHATDLSKMSVADRAAYMAIQRHK